MNYNLNPRRLWSVDELTRRDVQALIATATDLKRSERGGMPQQPLRGKNVALLCSSPASAPAAYFDRAAGELGAHVSHVRPDPALQDPSRAPETARLLGRLYDAIGCEGVTPELSRRVERDAGVPVYHDLGHDEHPARVLSDLFTMQEQLGKSPLELRVRYIGDARTPLADALLQLAALTGMQLGIVAPHTQWPSPQRMERAKALARDSGARLQVSEELPAADVDFVVDAHGVHPFAALGAKPGEGRSVRSLEHERADNRHYVLQAMLVSSIE
jgi:ornithine carbamoyltransferase